MCKRIQTFAMKNYAQLADVNCGQLGNINLFIGENGTGKSTILKALYIAARSTEDFRRGDDVMPITDILRDNVRWTFQIDKIGDLVTKGAKAPLAFSAQIGKDTLSYGFSAAAVSQIVQAEYTGTTQSGNSVFIPAREILSLQSIILKSRDIDRSFGFDNTYYDLAKALRVNTAGFAPSGAADAHLNELIGGKVEYDEHTGKWFYKKGNTKIPINTTSEGVKKLAIIERLMDNGVLSQNSILFLDEPEASLHPKAISVLMDVIDILANDLGIQVFIASHSYFVIKKLRILAMKRKNAMPCISLSVGDAQYYDLSQEMPDNTIIQESVRLYDEELNEVFG